MIKELGVDPTMVDLSAGGAQHELGAELAEIVGGQGSITRLVNTNGIYNGQVSTTTYYNPNKRYRYVRATAAIAQYDAVMYDTAGADTPYSVKKTAATTSFGFGICECTPVTTGDYFWLTVHGYVPIANVATGTTNNAFVAPSATAGRLDLFTFTTTAATLAQLAAGVAASVAGIYCLTNATSNQAAVFIHGN